MLVPSAVTKPHIKTLISSHEGRSPVVIVNDPPIRRIKQTMLEVDWLKAFNDGGAFSLNSIDSQYVAIFSNDFIFLVRVFEIGAVLLEFQLGLRVHR
jgi:hypothetical protein